MKYKDLEETKTITMQFLRALQELIKEEEREREDRKICKRAEPNWLYTKGTKYSSAVRRKSLDLTRKLAELRKY